MFSYTKISQFRVSAMYVDVCTPCIQTCMHVCIHTHTHTHMHTHAYAYRQTDRHTHTHTRIRIQTDRQTDTHTHTHTKTINIHHTSTTLHYTIPYNTWMTRNFLL